METLAVVPKVPKALPGRVILRFDKPKETYGSSKLIIPKTAQRIDQNVAEVVSIGAPTDRQEEMFCYDVKKGMKVIADHVLGDPFLVGEGDGAIEYRIFRVFEIIGLYPE